MIYYLILLLLKWKIHRKENMRTHIVTYRSANYKILGERILYDMTNEQAQEFIHDIKPWAHVMFPECAIIQLESLHGGDVIGAYCV